MRVALHSLWFLLCLALAGGCKDPGPPPHPPPDPKLDIVLKGEHLSINGDDIDVDKPSVEVLSTAFGQPPSRAESVTHYWDSLGVSVAISPGTSLSTMVLRASPQPYGMALDGGMQPFRGRLIVNGAWVHAGAKKSHLEKELDWPCNRGNQGWGVFARSPFENSWYCKVGGTRLDYWMKYRPNEDLPLAAFDIGFKKEPYPKDSPPPGLEEQGQGILKAFLELF